MLGRNELNVKDKPNLNPNCSLNPNLNITLTPKRNT